MMRQLDGKELGQLKDEYAAAVVEKMTNAEARAYLRQIFYNDVATADGLDPVSYTHLTLPTKA